VVPTVLLGLVDGGKTASITLDNAADVATIQLVGATLKVPGAKDLADPTMSNESVSTANLKNIVISGTTGTVNLNGSFSLDGTLSVTGTIQAFDLQADQSFKQGISITVAGSYSIDHALKSTSGAIVLDSGATLTMAANVDASTAVGLSGGIGINQTGGVITAPSLGARSAAGAIALNQPNAVDTFAASTVNKSVSVTSANALTIGAVTGVAGFTDTTGIVTGTGSATVTADSLTVSKALNVTTGTVTFAPRTLGQVDLGKADSGSALGIDATDLASVTAGGIRINAGSGKVNLAAALTVTPRLELDAGVGGVSGTGTLTADNVLVITTGAADFSAGHALKTIAISAGGKVTVNSTQPLTVGSVTVVGTFDGVNSGGADVTLKSTGTVAVSKALNAGAGVTRITAGGAVTQAAAGVVTAAGLGVVTSSGAITLDQANAVGAFIGAAQSGKDLRFTSTADLAVNTVGSDGALFTDPGAIATGGGLATIVGKSVTAKVAIATGAGTLRLRATNGGISQTAAISAGALGANATGSIDLSLATNAVGTVAVEVGAGQTAQVRVAGAVAVGSVAVDGGFPLTTGLTSAGGTITLRAGGAITLGAASNVGAAGTLGLEAAGDVTQSAGATITAGTLGVNSTGVITLNLANAVTSVAAVTSAAKAVTLVSTIDTTVGALAATGVFLGATGVSAANGPIAITTAGNKLTVGQAVTSGGANVTLTAKSFAITATVSALAGCVTILPGAGNSITIGDGGELTNAELALITAGVLQIGDFTNSDVSVVGLATLGANVPTLDLRAGGDLKTTAGADLTVTKLSLQTNAAAKVIDFTLGKSDATTLAIDAAGAASYADTGDVTVGAVAVCDGTETGATAGAGTLALAAAGKLTLNADVTRAGGAIRLNGGTSFEQTGGKLTGSTLELLGAGGTLTSATNNVATIAANVTGAVSYADADSLAIGTAGGTSNITAPGKTVRFAVGGALTGGAGTHVTAGQLAIKAASGVGPLSLAVGSVEAKTTTGDIQLTNAATLTIGGVAADLAGLQAPAGGVTVTVSTGTLQVTTEGINAFGETSLRADAMSITQSVAAKCVSLQQVTPAQKIDVGGADGAGTLGLADAELDQLSTTQGVRIGQAGGGAVTVTAKVDVAGPLELVSGGSITNAAGGKLIVGELALRAGGGVTLTGDNQVTKLAGKSGGDFTFRSVTPLNVGTVTVCGVALSGIDAAGQKVIISADPTFDQTVIGDCVILTPVNAGGTLDIGTQITDTTLNKIKAAVLQIGDATTGAITVSAPVSVSAVNLPAIHLLTNKTVTTLGTGAIGVSQLAVTANNSAADPAAVVLSGNNAVAKLAVNAQGDVTFANKANAALTITTVPTCGGTLTNVTGNGGSVTLIADEMDLGAQVNGGTKAVLLAPKSATTAIVLGANPGTAGTLELSDGELDNVTAGVLQIGTTSTGGISVDGAIDLTNGQLVSAVPTLDLRSSGSITGGSPITVQKLGVDAVSGSVGLTAANLVGTLAGSAKVDFKFTSGQAFKVDAVTTIDVVRSGVTATNGVVALTSANTIDLFTSVSAGTTVTFDTAAGGVGQNAGKVTASTLELLGTGTFYLDQAANSFGTFAAKVAGLTVVRTTGTLTIGDGTIAKGVTLTTDSLFIRTGAGFIFNGNSTSIDLGTGSGEVRSGLADDGSGKASAYPIQITSVAKDGTNRLTASAVNGFAIYGGTNSNVFNVTPSVNTPLFVRGGPPTRADVLANPGVIPGDTLDTPSVMNASVGLFNLMPDTGSGVFTFTDPNNGAIEVRRPIIFDNIENIRGLSIQASAVQIGANSYQILANGTVNGKAVVGGFSGVLPPLPPFLAAPAFTDPTVPYRAPTVAIGDVDGNGFPDVIIGAGPNSGGPLVTVIRGERVFNSELPPGSALSSSDIIATFFAYNPEFQGGVSVASVDFNADGFAEIVTGAGPGGGPEVRVFQYLKNQPPQSNIAPLTRFFAYEPNFLGGVRVSVGDVTGPATGLGDTKPDIVTAPGMGRTATIRVFDGNNLFPQFPDGTRTPFRQFDPYGGFRGGAFVDVGRYRDPNGKYADIVTGPGFGGGAHVIVFNGEKLATTNTVESVIQFFNDGPNDPRSPDPLAALSSGVGSVGFGFADTDDRLDIFVGSGLNRRTRVRVYLNNNGLANVSNGKILDYLNLAGQSPGPFDQRLDGANVAVSADNYRP
jgi:hypothetical protein